MTEATPPCFRAFGLHGPYELIGQGGEHLAYRHPYFAQLAQESLAAGGADHGVIAKLSCVSIREGNTGERDTDKAYLTQALGTLRQRQARTREIFGPDVVPWQESYLKEIWLSHEETAFVWDGEPPPREKGPFFAIETLQDAIPELLEPGTGEIIGLGLAYAERLAVQATLEVYSAVSTRWLQQSSRPPDSSETADFLKVHSNSEVGELFNHVARDKMAVASLRRFIDGCITYTQESGEVLDLVGAHNVIFLDDNRYKLVDVLAPEAAPIARLLPGILLKVQNQEGLNAREMNRLMNALGYLRFVNFMAAWLDLPERLEPLHGMAVDEHLWPQVQQLLHTSPMMSSLRRPTELAATC